VIDLSCDNEDERGGAASSSASSSSGSGSSSSSSGGASTPEVIDLSSFTNQTSDEEIARIMQRRFNRMARRSAKTDDGRDVLAKYRREIGPFVKESCKGLRVREIWPNPASQPGQPLFERFLAAYLDNKASDKDIQLCFHGTAEANVDAICRESLDPKRRAGQAHGPGEYFGNDALTSLAYCRGGRKMIVFAVLTCKNGLTKKTSQIIVVNKPEHQLPLFVVSFDTPDHEAHERSRQAAATGYGTQQRPSAAAMASLMGSAFGPGGGYPGGGYGGGGYGGGGYGGGGYGGGGYGGAGHPGAGHPGAGFAGMAARIAAGFNPGPPYGNAPAPHRSSTLKRFGRKRK